MPNITELERLAGAYSEFLFARGYIISNTIPAHPSGWREAVLDEYCIAYHPQLEFTAHQSTRVAITCLGIIFDTRYPKQTQDDYVASLAEALERSEVDMLQELSHSNGRYTLFYRTNDGRHYLLTDATGIRTALYHFGKHRTISSHINLLAAGEARHEPEDTRAFRYGFPGRQTPIQNVFLLTPNTKLSLQTGNSERYWPLKPITPMAFAAAASLVGQRLENAFRWISANYDPFITITAGLDSRVTLSIAKNEGRYATYYRRDDVDTDAVDRETAVAMAARFGLDHTLLTPDTRQNIPEKYITTVNLNTYRRHIPGMTYAYRQVMVRNPDRAVHIRSNLSEIGRMFYKYRGCNPKNAQDLVRLWSTNPALRKADNVASFDEFAESTGFFQAPVELTSLLYWEHRMGAWHSHVALESDIACESLSLYNCRHLLIAMLSIDQEAQKRSLLLKKIIMNRWPELAAFPVNGKPFSPTDAKHMELIRL